MEVGAFLGVPQATRVAEVGAAAGEVAAPPEERKAALVAVVKGAEAEHRGGEAGPWVVQTEGLEDDLAAAMALAVAERVEGAGAVDPLPQCTYPRAQDQCCAP